MQKQATTKQELEPQPQQQQKKREMQKKTIKIDKKTEETKTKKNWAPKNVEGPQVNKAPAA
jgi:hypothetical protein